VAVTSGFEGFPSRREVAGFVASLRSLAGAVDTAVVVAGSVITVVVAAVVAVTVVVAIPFAQDLSAKGHLADVRAAQALAWAHSGSFLSVGELISGGFLDADAVMAAGGTPAAAAATAAVASSAAFPLEGNQPAVISSLTGVVGDNGGCYLAAARSGSGNVFFITSAADDPELFEPGTAADCADVAALVRAMTPPLPVLGKVLLDEAMVGERYSVTIPFRGTADTTVVSDNLPAGLLLNPNTGVVHGTPTAAGDTEFQITAVNNAGSDTRTYDVEVEERKVMVTTWDTRITGCDTLTLPVRGTHLGTIDWGDGETTPLEVTPTHEYTDRAGLKTVTILGIFSGWGTAVGIWSYDCLISVDEWSNTDTLYLTYAFQYAKNLIAVVETPEGVRDMDFMLKDATKFNGSTAGFNTSGVRTIAGMFWGATSFNQPVLFDTAAVTDMSYLFLDASRFNQRLATFDTSNVTEMRYMFAGAARFNQKVDMFDTSKVTTMFYMFSDAHAFNQEVETFDTSNVTEMTSMFCHAEAFNHPLGMWDTSNVTDMRSMFHEANSFDQDISGWDVSEVTAWIAFKFHSDLTNAGVPPKFR
jgi:surface protein